MRREYPRAVLEKLRDIAGIVCFLSVGFAGIELGLFARAIGPKTLLAMENLDRTIIITGGAMTNLEKATRSLKTQEDQEALYVQRLSAKFGAIADNANASITRLNSTLDGLNTFVAHSDEESATLARDAEAALQGIGPTLASLNTDLGEMQPILKNAADITGDPALPQTIANLQHSSENLVRITDNTAAITGSAAKTADFYYRKLTTPTSAAVGALKVAAHYASLFAGALIGSWH